MFDHLKSELLYNFFMPKEGFIDSLYEYIKYYNNEHIRRSWVI
ncbi:MAG: IS3 family transposase [Peptostreptococcaceae bacterium]|nr:IS3 family transposase [Peptostreptococcaceae bacterium]